MNLTKLKKLLSTGETETVEFKEKPNESFYKNISSFANTKGGIILLGCEKGVFQKVGKTGRKIEYIITRQKPDKPDKNQTEIRQNE